MTSPTPDAHEEERLSALLDDELSEADALVVTRHLAQCARCMEELESIRTMRAAVRRLPALDPPMALYEQVIARADAGYARHRRSARLAAAALGGASLVGAVGFVAGGERAGTVQPPVEVFVVDHVARVSTGPMVTPVDLGTPRP